MVSVIVPVYGVEAYIERCLDSLLAQSYPHWEAILVDDGSPDRAGEICDAYARRESRFRVIHQANGGLSAARNSGLQQAKGQFVFFLDSDDWLHPHTLELLTDAATQNGAAMAMCNSRAEQEWIAPQALNDPPVCLLSGREALLSLYREGGGRFVVSWGKLWRRELLNGLSFPTGRIHEDEATTYRLLYPLDRFALVEAPLYCYFAGDNTSITRSAYSQKRLDVLTAVEEQIDYYRAADDSECLEAVHGRYLTKAIEQCDQIRTQLCDQALEAEVIGRVEAFCRERGLRISHSQHLLLTGDIASRRKLRTAKLRDLLHERGLFGCIAYYWKKI